MPITLRNEKGSELTFEELDDNFITLSGMTSGGGSQVNYTKLTINSADMGDLYNIGIELIPNNYLTEKWFSILSIGARMRSCDTSYNGATKLMLQHGVGSANLFEHTNIFDGGNFAYSEFTPVFQALYAGDNYGMWLTTDALPTDGDGIIDVYVNWTVFDR